MNSDKTIDLDIQQPAMRTMSAGTDCESILSFGPNGDRFELRVIHPESVIESIDAISRQIALIELSDHPTIRGIAQPLTSANPYSFGLVLPLSIDPVQDRLDRVMLELDAGSRIHVASQIIDGLGEAHRIGLCHGSLAPATVLVDRKATAIRALIDFSATAFDEQVSIGELSIESDLIALQRLLSELLLPIMESEQPMDEWNSIGGRQRVMLRRWLSDHAELPPTIGQWQSILPSPEDSRTQAADQTGVVELHSPDHEGSTSNLDGDFSPAPYLPHEFPEQLGRFRVVEKIGEGGMGTVFRATDLSSNQDVALKVLNLAGNNVAHAVRRFRKEARLLTDVANEHVTRLIDLGEDNGIHYLAMEFIDGIDLKSWLAGRGPLRESEALQIAADLARALVEAHSREVIHRDIKPENVLLQIRESAASTGLPPQERPISDFVVKLTDFGIARHVNQSESLEMTRAGAILGTPKYMSPEQCKSSEDIGPAADVYSLGITLYQLLTGVVPFQSNDAMKLAAMHCFDTPPSVRKKVAEISERTARIVDRALAKSPADRYGDASQLLQELQQTLRGESAAIETHPRMPEHDSEKLWEKAVQWDLRSSPEELWPLVSNTERLNEALGLPAVDYRTENDPQRGIRKFGSFKLSGVAISWEEHPFEWIEGQQMGILREFDSGPFKWFMSVVNLHRQPGGGTRLVHRVRIEPRNLLGRALTTIEADWKGFRSLKRVYHRMDQSIQARRKSATKDASTRNTENLIAGDPFKDVSPPKRSQQIRIDQSIERTINRGATPESAAALKKVVEHWAAQDLAHLRPLQLADAMQVNSDEMIDACLIAASEGLLNLRWDILCPTCRVAASTSDELSAIESHTHCEACDVDFNSNLGNAIEMVFCVHPEIREVNEGQYCIGGPEHSPHVIAQVRLEPQECLDLDVNLTPGDYLIRGVRMNQNTLIRVQSKSAPSIIEFEMSQLGGRNTPKLRAGKQTVTIHNDLETLQIVRLERTIPRHDVVTAATASALATFRRLFPQQTFAAKHPIVTETMSFLATQITNVDELYSLLGDAKAYSMIAEHHQLLSDIVLASGGTLVKTAGEETFSVFVRREKAVEAALRIQQSMAERLCESFEFGMGIHTGNTLVATQNKQLDYFGGTVRAASKLPEIAGRDILITESVYSDPAVRQRFLSACSEVETIDLPSSPATRCKRIRSMTIAE